MRRGAPSAGASRLPLVASEVMIVRPLLLPALRRLWRDRSTLQLGVDPARAVVLNDVGPATSTVLALLDGRHTLDDVVSRLRRELRLLKREVTMLSRLRAVPVPLAELRVPMGPN